ncbi:ABC transporter permease [Gryllotalpicola sp.]|uniref:ABC transporter permease n=1 Tax=Gryllotalpicola sp. TaxID=1932787 RepID=UPI002629F489|nr:ABC transporter permease [Gryllotalpicola sp.]
MNIVGEVLTTAIPGSVALLYPSLGELISERSGVTNLGTEGAMLAGALSGVAVTIATGNPWLGVLASLVAGAACGALHAGAVVWRRANQLASGLVVWFLALGVTSVLGSPLNGQVIDPLPAVRIPGLADIPGVGPALFDQNPLVYLAYVAVPALWFFITYTRPGLTLRATGERPAVVFASGSHPSVIRFAAVTVGSALAGLGGAQLSIGIVGNWSDDMTNGYGFVAVAVVIFARWSPIGVLIGSYLFGAALAVSSVVQANGIAVNQYLLDALPYAITIVVLVIVSGFGRSNAPESQRDALSETQ